MNDDDRKTVPEVPESKRGHVTIHRCGGGCPKGGDHQWDGPEVAFETPEGGGGGSVTCSKCGLAAIDHDMMDLP